MAGKAFPTKMSTASIRYAGQSTECVEAASDAVYSSAQLNRSRGMKKVRALLLTLLYVLMVSVVCGCGTAASQEPSTSNAAGAAKGNKVRVLLLDCPGAMGFASFAQKAAEGEYANNYQIAIAENYSMVEEAIESEVVDIALTYPGTSAGIYNETEGSVAIVDVSSLIGSSIITGSRQIKSLDNLSGKTIYATGENTPRTYALRRVLELAGKTDAVGLEFMSTEAEVVATLSENRSAVGYLTEPDRSAASVYNKKLHDVVSLSELWKDLNDDGTLLVGTVVIVRKAFYEEHPDAVKEFVEAHRESVEEVLADPYTYAPIIADLGLSESAEFAEASIPKSDLCCITGEEMRVGLAGYLQLLNEYELGILGGELPPDDFYLVFDDDAPATKSAPANTTATDEVPEDESEESGQEVAEPDGAADEGEGGEGEEPLPEEPVE